MKPNFINRIIIGALFLTAAPAFANIMSGEEREEKLAAIRDLLANEVRVVDAGLLALAPNPFVPNRGVAVKEEEKEAIVLSDDQLLGELAKFIKPTGTFVFGGEPYLVFNESRFGRGSQLPIVYENKEYNVTITNISGSGYAIRFGDAELQLKLK